MVICCPGAIDNNFHCDKKKDDKDVSFDIFDDKFISSLSYSSKTGDIKSSEHQYDKEINDILNLNNKTLSENRRRTLKGVIDYLNQKHSANWPKNAIREQLASWDLKDKDGRFKPYCGIVVWYLSKKLGQKR